MEGPSETETSSFRAKVAAVLRSDLSVNVLTAIILTLWMIWAVYGTVVIDGNGICIYNYRHTHTYIYIYFCKYIYM